MTAAKFCCSGSSHSNISASSALHRHNCYELEEVPTPSGLSMSDSILFHGRRNKLAVPGSDFR